MKLSGRERIIAIGAVGVIGALALDSVLITPLIDRMNTANAVVKSNEQALNDGKALIENQTAAARAWKRIAGESLKRDASAAEGQLLNKVRDYAQSSGLAVSSLKPERSEKENDFQRITVRASATGNMSQMSRFLYSLKNADIPLRVSDVQFAARKEGTDDLSLQIGVSTIYIPPPDPAVANPVTGVRQ